MSAIAAFHPKIDGSSVFLHPRLRAFLKGAQNAETARSERSAPWDLSLVLDALCVGCYEPLETVELSHLSHKLALLLALTSADRVSELCALSVRDFTIASGDSKATVYPDPLFKPKVVTKSYMRRPVTFVGFFSSA